mmetsp:Transcript_16530/g.29445  ORF Transcript_16530/g.29445 Transcript_16530/m.29445 type:complete len:229 (-) Transcript_16530:3649-4335(-)
MSPVSIGSAPSFPVMINRSIVSPRPDRLAQKDGELKLKKKSAMVLVVYFRNPLAGIISAAAKNNLVLCSNVASSSASSVSSSSSVCFFAASRRSFTAVLTLLNEAAFNFARATVSSRRASEIIGIPSERVENGSAHSHSSYTGLPSSSRGCPDLSFLCSFGRTCAAVMGKSSLRSSSAVPPDAQKLLMTSKNWTSPLPSARFRRQSSTQSVPTVTCLVRSIKISFTFT